METPFLQKKIWYLSDHGVWVTSGTISQSEKLYYINELDLEFEFKNQKLEILTNYRHKKEDNLGHIKPYRRSYGSHGDEILDIVEIRKPMYVLTACMDRNIRVFSFSDTGLSEKDEIIPPIGILLI